MLYMHFAIFFLLSWQLLQYNTMAMRTKCIKPRVQSRKSTLRSAYKQSLQNTNATGCSSDEKVIDQIKKQIEHQQAFNASKSTYPHHEEHRTFKQALPEKVNLSRNQKKHVSSNIKSQSFENNNFSNDHSFQSQQSNENSLSIKIHAKEKNQRFGVDSFMTPSKSQIRNQQFNKIFSYKAQRKSYRKQKRRIITSIPYRKCQDQFEQKIVTLMNKICFKKQNDRDIDGLCQKIQKITLKDIYNPYVISGIKTILKLLEKSVEINVTCLVKLKEEVKQLSNKILVELGKTEDYEQILFEHRKIDIELTKPMLIRKIYKMLIKSQKIDCYEARQKSICSCDAFFKRYNSQVKEDDILNFLKDEQFLKF